MFNPLPWESLSSPFILKLSGRRLRLHHVRRAEDAGLPGRRAAAQPSRRTLNLG